MSSSAAERASLRDCRLGLTDGDRLAVTGIAETSPRGGRFTLLAADGVPGARCHPDLRVVVRRGVTVRPGGRVVAVGRWRSSRGEWRDPLWSGELVADSLEDRPAEPWSISLWRVAVHERLISVFPRTGSMVAALVLARRDGIAPELREAFTRAGTAHLLAISGFHVGVVAGLMIAVLQLLGCRRRLTYLGAAGVVWLYVAFIGAPDAAARAALIVSLVALGRAQGRPLHPVGSLATAMAALLLLDPQALARPGFQLSFAGALGLAVGARPLDRELARVRVFSRAPGVRGATAAGISATLATMPIVAWHFEQVSLVGIPATIVGSPLLTVAIPGIFITLLVHGMHAGAGLFLAGGVELVLEWLASLMTFAGSLSLAVLPVSRPVLLVAMAGGVAAGLAVRSAVGVRRSVRAAVGVIGATAALAFLPVARGLTHGSTIELRFIDVGQGDAIALRSPRGRWMIVDTGPAGRGNDLVPMLGRWGVRRLDALILTHPDLDHIGRAAELVESIRVGSIAGPGFPRGTGPYLGVLRAAEARGASWVALRAGDAWDWDGLQLEVFHPGPDGSLAEPNDNSVVLRIRYGLFVALLTGDAPAAVEDALAARIGAVDLLKVAHHGSRTSSATLALESWRPALAVVSAGRGNRFGHPHEDVLGRLQDHADQILRTDLDGTVTVRGRADGAWTVRTTRQRR